MSKPLMRVKIPSKAPELIDLMKKVLAKHTADGAKSPLNSVNMTDFSAKVLTASTANDKAAKLKKDSETAYEERNLSLGVAKGQLSSTSGTALYYLKGVREVLLGIFKGHEHRLGDWGFNIDTSPRPRKVKKDEKETTIS